MTKLTYYIRSTSGLLDDRIKEPRRRTTMRRSLDGKLAIVAFRSGDEPKNWDGAMTEEQCRDAVSSEEAKGVWWVPEEF